MNAYTQVNGLISSPLTRQQAYSRLLQRAELVVGDKDPVFQRWLARQYQAVAQQVLVP